MTARTRRADECVFIGPGAVSQHDGPLRLYLCNRCGNEVVWATSRKTGRKYLVNVSHSYRTDARFYIGANVHDCEGHDARQAAYAEERDRELLNAIMGLYREQGKCIEMVANPGGHADKVCGEPAALDLRTNEPYSRCADCILDLKLRVDSPV